MAVLRACANSICSCRSADVTCSVWCGSGDIPSGVRCLCRHEGCLAIVPQRPGSVGMPSDLDPRRLDTFRPERRPPAAHAA